MELDGRLQYRLVVREGRLMARRLHVVATCTDRKTLAAPSCLLVRNLPSRSNGAPDVDVWLQRRDEATAESIPAEELYKGELWTSTLRLRDVARATTRQVVLWVASAGYGLIRADAEVKPYGATFAQGAADSVSRARTGLRADQQTATWWRALTDAPASEGTPASIAELAGDVGGDDLLVVMSASYVAACREDLLAASDLHERAVLVSAGAAQDPDHAGWAVDFDARVQGEGRPLDGSRISLNVRVAEHLVREAGPRPLDRTSSAAIAREIMEGLVSAPRYSHRRAATDEEVLDFARSTLRAEPSASASAALRRFRDEAERACEQKRFAKLFREAKRELAGAGA